MFFVDWLKENPLLLNTLTLVVLVLAAWLLGAWLAKAVRMTDYGWKFGCIFFAVFASMVIIYRGWPPKLGIDLGGGAILVYRVDPTATDWRPEKMDALVAAISERVNPGGQKEISTRSLGTDMVQIIMPTVSGATSKDKQIQMDEIKNIIKRTGALEFRIVATRRFNQSLIESAAAARKAAWEQAPGTEKGRIYYVTDPKTGIPKEVAEWCRVRDKEVDKIKGDPAAIELQGKDESGKDLSHIEVLVQAPDSSAYDVTGRYIRDAAAALSPEGSGFEVTFRFNAEGGQRMGRLTEEHMPLPDGFHYRLAIVLDHILQSAPTLNDRIADSGRITGDFDQKEAQDLADIINRGSLPAALAQSPEREMVTEATLGADTIRQSLWAMTIAAIAVPLFMLYYYRFAGLVAVMVLSLTVLMLIAIMILVKAPFTLTALAGLALAVGMEVDNNVLIYERLREELHHGAALRMGLRNAFHRVGVVIVDANITHVLAAAVLFYVGTEQVKGFAITFLLGALLSIWATMFVAKTIFEVCERRRWVQHINMRQWIGHTTIDFMRWFPAAATFSVVITVLGVIIAVVRGQGLFDIDFTGGISVQTVFRQGEDIQSIRKVIAEHDKAHDKDLPDATVTPVHTENEAANRRFVIDTSNSDGDFVKKLIQQLFGDKLVTAIMTYEIGAPAAKSPGEKPPVVKPAEKLPESPAAKPAASVKPPAEPMPSEPPADKSVPKPEPKASGAAPTRAPPASTGSAPSAPAPKGKTLGWTSGSVPQASDGPGASSDLPPASLVAMAGPEAVLIAQAEKSKADAKTTGQPDVKTEAKAPAASSGTANVAPVAKPAPKLDAKRESKPEATPAPSSAEAAPAPSAQPIQATLVFDIATDQNATEKGQRARYDKDQVLAMIQRALEDNKVPAKWVHVDLSNPFDAVVTDRWTAKFLPITGAKITLTPALVQDVLKNVQAQVAKQPYFPGVDNMGSAVAGDTRFWACVALVLSWSLIILYLWIRFQGVAFGLAAVIALIHDVFVMLGAIAFSSYLALIPGVTAITLIEPFKINLTIVAAFLTIIGYSVNDTIIVFDRIREIRGKSPTLTRQMVNDATNQTLGRTVLTSFTVLMVVLILYIFGGQAVHGFAFALIIGVLTGTYSSIYVAAPVLLWLLHPKEMKGTTSGS
jgi:SecD/SecF fusion protein